MKLRSQPDADFPLVPKTIFPQPKIFNYSQHEDESMDIFFDRVIDESDPFAENGNQIQMQPANKNQLAAIIRDDEEFGTQF